MKMISLKLCASLGELRIIGCHLKVNLMAVIAKLALAIESPYPG